MQCAIRLAGQNLLANVQTPPGLHTAGFPGGRWINRLVVDASRSLLFLQDRVGYVSEHRAHGRKDTEAAGDIKVPVFRDRIQGVATKGYFLHFALYFLSGGHQITPRRASRFRGGQLDVELFNAF